MRLWKKQKQRSVDALLGCVSVCVCVPACVSIWEREREGVCVCVVIVTLFLPCVTDTHAVHSRTHAQTQTTSSHSQQLRLSTLDRSTESDILENLHLNMRLRKDAFRRPKSPFACGWTPPNAHKNVRLEKDPCSCSQHLKFIEMFLSHSYANNMTTGGSQWRLFEPMVMKSADVNNEN